MVILSKWMLFLDGDHLGLEDCNDEDDQVILSKRMLFLDGDHRLLAPHLPLLRLLLTTPLRGLAPRTGWFLA